MPYQDINKALMEHQAFVSPIEQTKRKYPKIVNYLSDVASGRVAMGTSPYSYGGGLQGLANTLQSAQQGNPEGLLDYVGPGAIGMPAIGAMTAWHGSPHKFDKFSMEKIGTGEGYQAYGHGLYFAESPGVAHTYKTANSMNAAAPPSYEWMGDSDLAPIANRLLREAEETGTAPQDVVKKWQKLGAQGEDFNAASDQILSENYRTILPDQGHLYEVDIPDQYVDNFLDWDKPLSEQPEVFELVKNSGFYNNYLDRLIRNAGGPDKFNGGAAYKALENIEEAPIVSKMFNDAGIKGIKYFDASSRGAGEGTRNLVVFDEDIVKILNKE